MSDPPKLMTIEEYWQSMENGLRSCGYPPEKLEEAKTSFYAGACCILLGALGNAAHVPKQEGTDYIDGLMQEAIKVQQSLKARLFNRIFGSGANN